MENEIREFVNGTIHEALLGTKEYFVVAEKPLDSAYPCRIFPVKVLVDEEGGFKETLGPVITEEVNSHLQQFKTDEFHRHRFLWFSVTVRSCDEDLPITTFIVSVKIQIEGDSAEK